MMLGGAHDPGVIALDDEQVTAIARRELHAAMGIDVAPVFSGVFRHPAGIPQYTVGHAERLERIDAALAGLPGLHVAGNSYRGVAINSCVADAGPLADRVLAGS
jgi:oxygen-dependent protoporphyrinogen oxidase